MIKRLLVLFFLISSFSTLRAQIYGNEWINYSQKYYKIKVAQNGIYRLDSLSLSNAGIPIGSIDPRNIQLFLNGVEQYIFVNGESDAVLNAADYIEFYGKKNDGKNDSVLYVNTAFVPNPYYSLINDTSVYFLTWNNLTTNRRMTIENDTSFSSYSPSSYFFKEEIQAFNNAYYPGETNSVGGTDSRYTKSEGWFDANVFDMGSNVTYSGIVNTSNKYAAGPKALFKTVVIGASKNINLTGQFPPLPDHHLTIEYRDPSASFLTLKDTFFIGYESSRFTDSIPVSNLGTTTTDFRYSSITEAAYTSNRTTVSYIYLKYPHTMDMEGKTAFDIFLPDNLSFPKSYLNINNFNASGGVILYDLSNHKRIDVVQVGANYNVLIPNSGYEKHCYITSASNVVNVTSLQPVTPTAFFTDYASQSTDSAYVIITHKTLMSEALLYKQYRSTNIYGGNHNVVTADIDDLYDQFAYGIVKSPLAIRNFAKYLIATYPSVPQNMFLIGKSVHLADCRQNPPAYDLCLVPSMGYPSSDILLTSGLSGTTIVPAIPTGRLAARIPNDVTIYLDKIKDYENTSSNPPSEWKKYGLHFGGGGNPDEQNMLRNYLNNYKYTFQDTLYGGTIIKEFWKTSSAPIQINIADTLEDLINTGVSLMTFFGHASSNSFDQSIDDILSYNPPPGHYPFMISNACYSGDLHADGFTSSEEYVLTQNKGVIGFLGAINLGVPYALDIYTSEFYRQFCNKSYGAGVGKNIQKTIETVEPFALTDALELSTCFEMALHGDPAVNINAQPLPDFKITNADVYFDLTSQIDTFTVNFVRTNIGRTYSDSVFTEITHTLPDGTQQLYSIRGVYPKFKDTASFKIWIDVSRAIGLNKIKISLDALAEVNEMSESNNATGDVPFVLNGGAIAPVYPYEFAIIPTDTITLKATTADLFASPKNYIFQLDTTDTFDSPFLKQTIINAPGGVVRWSPTTTFSFTFSDSTVYYWRVSPDSTSPTNGFVWRESSFQYIQNKKGWGQSHFFQFKNDGYEYVNFNRAQRKWDFVNDVRDIYCRNGIYPHIVWTDIVWKLNGIQKAYWGCMQLNSGFLFVVFDDVSLNNMQSPFSGSSASSLPNGIYENCHCRAYAMNTFDFISSDSLWRSRITNFINNDIPNNDYVMVYSMNSPQPGTFEPSLLSAFGTLGINQITNMQDKPYIAFGRKGMTPGTATEIIGDTLTSTIQLDTSLVANWNEGYISSPVIGPASSWGSLHWRQHTVDGALTNDSIVVRVVGIAANGTETVLANFTTDSTDILDLAAYADAASFPNIRLMAFMKDDSLHTPPQMERWQVIYSPVPEAAINPPLGYSIAATNLQEGDSIRLRLPIENIGAENFTDSLLVSYWIEDASRNYHYLPDKLKKKPFVPNEVIIDSNAISTENYPGKNALWVEVNPINKPPHSQLEQYHFNNIIRIPFDVSVDRVNPLLDVTFDGVHIMNNDIVSAKPNILIKLKDENQFLALNDTSDFKVFLQYPGTTTAQRVWFINTLTFTEAVLPNNSCKINFAPYLVQDGVYQLLVQAKDKSNNQSGAIDYKINFEVINKSTITEVMNYPNPFSTSTKFVFTLTGDEVPSTFKIQIMTITGKVVKEIFQDELGAIHVGRNITEYAWDGKDEFGDQLANGIYLYRVITKINGEDIEKRETGADQYFKKGWGKMYLMR